MAIIAWTIPFAAVVTPGSLTVVPARNVSTIAAYVPQPQFDSSMLGQVDISSSNIQTNSLVYKLAFNTASACQPVAIRSDFQNETYSLAFTGPAVRCAPANESLVRNFTLTYGVEGLDIGNPTAVQYLSWVPGTEPYWTSTRVGSSGPDFSKTLDLYSLDVARIWVMNNLWTEATWNKTIYGGVKYGETINAVVVNVTECQLYNATYNVYYAFRYPNQTSQVSISNWLNPISLSLEIPYGDPTNATAVSTISYLSVMQAFGKLLVGSASEDQYGNTTTYTSWQIIDVDWYRGPMVQADLENLFQNLTLSLLSNNEFIKSVSDASPVQLSVTTFLITYTYASWQLLTSYGLAFFFALLCAVVGMYAFFVNGASYPNTFSSFLRATSGHKVHSAVDTDSDGADPLPRNLAKTRVTIGLRNRKPI